MERISCVPLRAVVVVLGGRRNFLSAGRRTNRFGLLLQLQIIHKQPWQQCVCVGVFGAQEPDNES